MSAMRHFVSRRAGFIIMRCTYRTLGDYQMQHNTGTL